MEQAQELELAQAQVFVPLAMAQPASRPAPAKRAARRPPPPLPVPLPASAARVSATAATVTVPPTKPYVISTITWTGCVGCSVNFGIFYNLVTLYVPDHPLAMGQIVWVDFHGLDSRGVYPKRRRPKLGGAIPARKAFDNQVTAIYQMGPGYFPNVKLFYNGNIHITGLRTPEDGESINAHLVRLIREMHASVAPDILDVSHLNYVANARPGAAQADLAPDAARLEAKDFSVCMINSDFRVPFRVRRRDVHRLLISPQYGNSSVFQPSSYPGVKLQFFWNENQTVKNGHCVCDQPCIGKSDGCGEGRCKKVTVVLFESGSILITGSNAVRQIDSAYTFITEFLQKHRAVVEKVLPEPIADAAAVANADADAVANADENDE